MRKRWLYALFLVPGAVGCQQGPYLHTHLEAMQAEKRALEDAFYELEFEYEEACRELARLRNEAGEGHSQSTAPSRKSTSKSRPARTRESTPDSSPSLSPPMIDEGMLTEPQIELPKASESRELPLPKSSSAPQPAPSPPPLTPSSSAHLEVSGSLPVNSLASARSLSLDPADPRVTHIALNQQLTAARNFDRQQGDDGIVVVVEPRNRENAFVPLAGPIAVVVLDPAKTPEQGRIVARWDMDANQAQQALRNSPQLRGMELRLPWPASPPEASRLHLYVRYTTVDNRELRADRPLYVHLPGQVTQQWTPRAGRRTSGSPGNFRSDQTAPVPMGELVSARADEPDLVSLEQPSEPMAAGGQAEVSDFPDESVEPSQQPDPSPADRPEWRPDR